MEKRTALTSCCNNSSLELSLTSWPTNSGKISRTRRKKISIGMNWFSLVRAAPTTCARRVVHFQIWMDDWRTTLTASCLAKYNADRQNTIPARLQRPTGGLGHNCLGHLFVVPNLELARNPRHLELQLSHQCDRRLLEKLLSKVLEC
jgi:hypothetical protein